MTRLVTKHYLKSTLKIQFIIIIIIIIVPIIAIVPIVVGCTGVVDKTFAKYIEKIPGKINIFEIQKITLLGTCYAVRRFLMN